VAKAFQHRKLVQAQTPRAQASKGPVWLVQQCEAVLRLEKTEINL
jgi:hypothetical protein